MGTYIGTDLDDRIAPDALSAGVTSNPPGTTPSAADDLIDGRGGEDTLYGAAGQDTIKAGTGNDIVLGGDGDDVLQGNDGDDYLAGGAGGDIMDGGLGADVMEGKFGNDTYYVDNVNDKVFEPLSAEMGNDKDIVLATVSYTLGDQNSGSGYGVEELWLQGSGNIDAHGNESANILLGNGGDNLLNGRDGGDTLKGKSGDDELRGGKGLDKLTGGKGDDDFVFSRPKEGSDVITDFRSKDGNSDRLLIDASHFKGGLEEGRLSKAEFQSSNDLDARDADVRFIFLTTDETLWFDKNGSKKDGLVLIADLQGNASVEHNDFVLF